MITGPRGRDAGDATRRATLIWELAWLCALAAGVVVLVLQRPPTLDYADETYVLYEAKRLLHGEVLYRDVFEIITPLFLWLIAAGYALFGVDMGVARAIAAGLQAGIAVTLYGCCRLLGVRRSLAAAAAAFAIAVCQPLWPIASPHWLSTLCIQAFVLSLLGLRRRSWTVRWLVPGLVLGILAANQHQKALPFAAVGLAVIAFDVCTSAAAGRLRLALQAVTAFGAGTVAIIGPVLAVVIAQAGFAPVYYALIVFPTGTYRKANRTGWGRDFFGLPNMMRYVVLRLSWVLALLAPLVIAAFARREWARARGTFVVLLTGLASLASVAYFPDIIHLAFIGGIFVIGIADCVERFVRVPARRWAAVDRLAVALAVGAIAWSGIRLETIARDAAALAWVRLETAYGTIAAPLIHPHAMLYAQVRAMVDRDPQRRLFAHPWMSGFYLLTDAQNPTPYQCLQVGYTPPAHVARVVADLEAAAVPTVLLSEYGTRDPTLTRYMQAHYRSTVPPSGFPPVQIFERRRD